jgi:large subunit ribosomal protein L17
LHHAPSQCRIQARTQHQPRRALLRNLVTSVIIEDRVETTVAKAKAVRPLVEKMITLGKKGDLHSRRQALSFLMTDASVERLFDTVAPRYGDRQGGYLRIVRTGFQKGDGAEKAFIELLGAEKQLEVKRQKRDDIKAKKRAELEKQLEESKKEEPGEEAAIRSAGHSKRASPCRRSPFAFPCCRDPVSATGSQPPRRDQVIRAYSARVSLTLPPSQLYELPR